MKTELIKTNIKGLFLTTDGKVWHKSAKREIIPTEKGIIRFNGKKYNLQKLTNELTKSDSKKDYPKKKHLYTKPPLRKGFKVADLLKQGYRKTSINGLYITNFGKCYNTVTRNSLKPTARGTIIISNKSYNLAKLILQTFKKEPIRSGRVNFKNRITNDFYFENLEYQSTILRRSPTDSDLIQCIRLYFNVESDFNKHNVSFKYYLSEIVKHRGFNHNTKDFVLFTEWIAPLHLNGSQSKQSISKRHGYSCLNGNNIINGYLLQLVAECLQDYENGFLSLKDFLPKPPRKKSDAQLVKEFKKNFQHLDNLKT